MFSNRVVLITGGSAGIGAATALCFAKEGATLAIVGRNETKLKNVARCCEKLGAKTHVIKADVAKDVELKTIIQQTITKYGKLDVLVNNAGILRLTNIFRSDILNVYDEVMKTNLRAVIHITNLAIPYLKKTKGNVVNVSSAASMTAKLPNSIVYGISKAGLDYFTRSSARELSSFGVRLNCVNPGVVNTEMTHEPQPPEFMRPSLDDISILGRISDAEEIADLILYLASEKAKSITGSNYVIDNGFLLK